MTDHIPPQQELEKLLSGIIKLHYSEIIATTKAGTRPTETIADLAKLIAQTRTDTIREVEDRHQLALAQSKLAVYKKVQKTLQAGQLPVVATVFDAEITQLEREVTEREGRTE